MENAVDALKMAFAVLVFVIALSIAMITFSQARATSQTILYAKDETNYYDYQAASGKAQENRIVGLETIIPTIYKYNKERYKVIFKQAKYDINTGEFNGNVKNLEIYTTTTNPNLWNKGYSNEFSTTNSKSTSICSFDIEEETKRLEPWVGSPKNIAMNLDAFMQGGKYLNPKYTVGSTNQYITYKSSFIQKYTGKRFLETIGEISIENTGSGAKSESTKKIITYTLID